MNNLYIYIYSCENIDVYIFAKHKCGIKWNEHDTLQISTQIHASTNHPTVHPGPPPFFAEASVF